MSLVRTSLLVAADRIWSRDAVPALCGGTGPGAETELEAEVQDVLAVIDGADGMTALPLLPLHDSVCACSRSAAVALNNGISNNDGGPTPFLESNTAVAPRHRAKLSHARARQVTRHRWLLSARYRRAHARCRKVRAHQRLMLRKHVLSIISYTSTDHTSSAAPDAFVRVVYRSWNTNAVMKATVDAKQKTRGIQIHPYLWEAFISWGCPVVSRALLFLVGTAVQLWCGCGFVQRAVAPLYRFRRMSQSCAFSLASRYGYGKASRESGSTLTPPHHTAAPLSQ